MWFRKNKWQVPHNNWEISGVIRMYNKKLELYEHMSWIRVWWWHLKVWSWKCATLYSFWQQRKVKIELDGYKVYNVCFQCTHINIIVMIISSNKHHYLCCIMVVPIKMIRVILFSFKHFFDDVFCSIVSFKQWDHI